ncbi:MAG: hypothetical protein JXB35_00295 [Anaerolineae bacterium]|nr:hypothetical protein [Anaerolineae bacterium]
MIDTRATRRPWGLITILAGLLAASLLLAGCNPTEPQTATPETTPLPVNVVETGGLRDTAAISIYELDNDAAYTLRRTILNPEVIQRLVETLDAAIPAQPKTSCIPSYRIQFQLKGGAVTTLEIGCSSEDLSMLRGDLETLAGEDFTPPAAFIRALEAQLEAQVSQPETLNVSQYLGLDLAVAVELVKNVVSQAESGMAQTDLVGLAYISDPATVEAILESLHGELEIGPRADCPAQYFVIFHFVDGAKTPLSYGDCEGAVAPFLRGQYGGELGQDAIAPEAFNMLVLEQIRIAEEALPTQN